MKAREAAYLALLASLRHEGFIAEHLQAWKDKENPASHDFALAKEIAYGSARMALSLDYLAAALSKRQRLSLKLKETALVRMAYYQHFYMSKIPLYAIAAESVELAKKYCHLTFAGFLYAIISRLSTEMPALPSGGNPEDLSIRHSYPLNFVKCLLDEYGTEKTEEILKAGNIPSKTMARLRPGHKLEGMDNVSITKVPDCDVDLAIIENADEIPQVAASPSCYIQNITPVTLTAHLTKHTAYPQTILDLCASPGGKLLAAHDAFPNAKLFGNDIAPDKIMRLTQNFAKYGIPVQITCGRGEEFPAGRLFDLIILDVPCSNSGVLNKRPEARWRLTEEVLQELAKTQMALVEHATTLLAPGGNIWYMTCSILDRENDGLIKAACKEYGLKAAFSKTLLPNADGWDGGYACRLFMPQCRPSQKPMHTPQNGT